MKPRTTLLYIWLLALLLSPITILRNISLQDVIREPVIFLNAVQRLTGLVAITMLFFQIVLGAYINTLTEKLGGWIFKFHLRQGIIAYSLVLIHPIAYLLIILTTQSRLDIPYIFLPQAGNNELAINLGRVAFLLLTVAVIAAKLRTHPFFQRNWRKLHTINYLVVALLLVHSIKTGSDALNFPFVILYPVFLVSLLLSFYHRRIKIGGL